MRFEIFVAMREIRAFERRQLACLRTLEDVDIVIQIGLHQAERKPLTLKRLFLLDIASMATVHRRLRRLKQHGVIHQRRCEHDRRNVELTISPRFLKIFERYGELLGALPRSG